MRVGLFASCVAAGWLVVSPGMLGAQELDLRRRLPPPPAMEPCAEVGVDDASPGGEARAQAERLMQAAAEARILDDAARARQLLEDAVAADPSSSEAHFELARVLEGMDEPEAAVAAYCRYLALAPAGTEADEADAGIERLAELPQDSIPPTARTAFRDGVEWFDASNYDAAVREFSRALVERPDWPEAHLNRGLAYLRAGREGAGLSDFERYLELRPSAEEAGAIRARLAAAEPPAPGHSAATALAAGLVVPGMGQFYTGRPGAGTLYLLGAAGSAAAGLLYTRVEVVCRLQDVTAGCPPEHIEEERTERPFLVAGLGAAGAITLFGAVHAFLGARGGGDGSSGSELSLLPSEGLGPLDAFAVSPGWDPATGGVGATFRVRF